MSNTAPTLTLDATAIAKDLATRIAEVDAERINYRARKAEFKAAGHKGGMVDYFQAQADMADRVWQELFLQANRWGIIEMVEEFMQKEVI